MVMTHAETKQVTALARIGTAIRGGGSAAIAVERCAACNAIAAKADEVHELTERIAVAEDFEVAEAMKRGLAKAQFDLAKLEKKIGPIDERLKSAIAAELAARHTKHVEAYAEARARYVATATKTMAAFREMLAVRDAVAADRFHDLMQTLSLPPHLAGSPLLAQDLIDGWARDTPGSEQPRRGLTAAVARKPQLPPDIGTNAQRTGLSQTPTPAGRIARSVPAVAPEAVPRTSAPDLPDDIGELGIDEVWIRVLRAGYTDTKGVASQRGRVVKMKRTYAETAVANGAVEFASAVEAAPDVNASSEGEGA